MPSLVGSGRIERLEILNFKSLKCHQIVGPFKDFAAIINANGAGRTDLEDAIAFVLGVRSFELRGAQQRDDRDHRDPRGRIAFVKLVFSTGSGEEIKFGRAITSSGTSEYRINNIPVTWEIYNNIMKGLDILGEIGSDACKDNKDPAAVSGPLSAPQELKKIQVELEILKIRAEEKMLPTHQKRKMVAAERKQKREEKDETDERLRFRQEVDLGTAEQRMEMDFKNKMESLSADIERTASDFEALDQYEGLREKERKSTEELEAARTAAVEAADKWKKSKELSFRSLASPLSVLDGGDTPVDATKVTAYTRSKSRLKINDIVGKEKLVGFQSVKEMNNSKSGELNRNGGAGVSLEVDTKDKKSRSLQRNKSLHRDSSLQRSRSLTLTRSQALEDRKVIYESHRPAETPSQPDATSSDAHTSQRLEDLDDQMYSSDIDQDKDSLGKAEELADKLFRDAMEMHTRFSADVNAALAVSRLCLKGQSLLAETKETYGVIMYANGHGQHSRLGEESMLMSAADSESRPLSFSQTSECSDTPRSGLGQTERAHLDRMEENQRVGSTHLNENMEEKTTKGDDGMITIVDDFRDSEKDSAMEKEMNSLRGSNARKQVKIDSLQKWRAYYKSELEVSVQTLEQIEKRHAKETKKKDKVVRKMELVHGKEIAHRDAKCEGMEEKLREQITELNLVIEELSGQLYDMEEHLAEKGIPYKHSVNENSGPSSKTLLSAVISVKEAAHTFSRTFMAYLKQHLTKARDLDEQICLESEVIVAKPSDYKFLVQSFICRRMFLDFDSECFNIESCMTEIFDIDEHSKASYQEYMTYMNVAETVTLLTDNRSHNAFLREFCFKKFLHIVSESTEEAFIGDFNHSDDICAGRHPSSRFYESYCKLAVSVWLLHRLAFSFQPPARMISVRKGAHFNPAYMESAVPGISDGDLGNPDGPALPFEALVGLMVHPGFRVGSSIIPAQVYLVTT